jgi:hypothetical protein
MWSSLNLRDCFSHSYKANDKISYSSLRLQIGDGKTKDSEPHGSEHSPNLVCSLFPRESDSHLLPSFPNFRSFQTVYAVRHHYTKKNVMHSGGELRTNHYSQHLQELLCPFQFQSFSYSFTFSMTYST